MGEFDDCFFQVASLTADGNIPFNKYKSRKTGITVCIAQAEGPLVASYLCFATEVHNDDGLPHTLEHLVFLGSEKYPYKGVLDLLSNRCLASGTNAWTDTDHTCYTLTTAGIEGTLTLLPIYLDHLLFPTLTDAGYTTEVHHINEKGEDAGIVYCEMQSHENTAESRCYRTLLNGLYPAPSGYSCDTGGRLRNLRESTNNQKIRQYHKDFYRPENLCIILVGKIDVRDIFRILQPVERRILQEPKNEPFIRPWLTPIPPLTESSSQSILYPCDEEEYGNVLIGFRGPEIQDYFEFCALRCLLTYLTYTSVSPMQKAFVEIEEPLANDVDYHIGENLITCFHFQFSNVPVDKMSFIKDKLFSLIESHIDGSYRMDMKQMETIILKEKLSTISEMESNPHQAMAGIAIGDFLYGDSLENLKQRLQPLSMLDAFMMKDDDFWISLLKTYCIEGKYILVIGTPSQKLGQELTEEEKLRIEKQQESLGEGGLAIKAKTLKNSILANKVLPPQTFFSAFTMPSVEKLNFHSIKRGCNVVNGPGELPDFDFSQIPCRFQVDDVKSNFVQIYALFDTADIPTESRSYLPLLVELLVESSICKDGETTPHEEVVKQLTRDTVSYSLSIGLSYHRFYSEEYSQAICFSITLEPKKYVKGVQWIKDVFHHTVFEPSKIKSTLNKMVKDIAAIKMKGSKVASMMSCCSCFSMDSNRRSSSMMHQHGVLTKILKDLETNPSEVCQNLFSIRDKFTQLDKMTIHLGANLALLRSVANPEEPWKTLFPCVSGSPAILKEPLKQCYDLLLDFEAETNRDEAIGLSSVDSGYLFIASPGLTSFNDPDYPALLVLLQYLIQCEGPMWNKLRGLGLSYGYKMACQPHEGLIYFQLHMAAHIAKAYEEGKNITLSYLDGKTPWQKSLYDSAIGSLMFALIEKDKFVPSVIRSSMKAYYKGVDWSFNRSILQKIKEVPYADMERVGRTYLTRLFNIKTSKASLVCSTLKVGEICKDLDEQARHFEVTALENYEMK